MEVLQAAKYCNQNVRVEVCVCVTIKYNKVSPCSRVRNETKRKKTVTIMKALYLFLTGPNESTKTVKIVYTCTQHTCKNIILRFNVTVGVRDFVL